MTRFVILCSIFALTACPSTEEEDPGEHACEEVGAGEAVTAGEVADDTAPEIHMGEGHLITLVDGAPSYVRVVADEQADALLFVDTADVVTGLWHDGAEEDLPAASPNAFCETDIPEHFDLHVDEGTLHIELGDVAVDQVWLMVASADGHGHEDE